MTDYYSTAEDISKSNCDTLILPVGSTEQHGPHLPVHTDTIIAERLSEKLAEITDAVLFPVIPYSTCREHSGVKGSVYMNADTFYKMMWDICECFEDQGFKRIIIIQGHGGIFIMTPFVRDFNAKHTNIKIIRPDYDFIPNSWNGILESHGLHSDESETSLMLYLCEELVKKERFHDCTPDVLPSMLNIGSVFNYSPTGVWGKPSLATKEKGKKIFNVIIENYLANIKEAEKILGKQSGGKYDVNPEYIS